jgi:hypothetical protein
MRFPRAGVCAARAFRLRLAQLVEDRKRVRLQRLRARPAAAWRVTAVVEGNDVAMRKKAVQDEGHRPGVPRVPAKTEQYVGAPSGPFAKDGIRMPARA